MIIDVVRVVLVQDCLEIGTLLSNPFPAGIIGCPHGPAQPHAVSGHHELVDPESSQTCALDGPPTEDV